MAIDVILADDLEYTKRALRAILERAGFNVVGEANNGLEAVTLFSEERPDIVLLDITMPVMDGLQSLREIRAIDPDANVIMCTALGQDRLIDEAIAAGARDFVVKPFTAERIVTCIKRVLDIV